MVTTPTLLPGPRKASCRQGVKVTAVSVIKIGTALFCRCSFMYVLFGSLGSDGGLVDLLRNNARGFSKSFV
jgi:hypothetical protein